MFLSRLAADEQHISRIRPLERGRDDSVGAVCDGQILPGVHNRVALTGPESV
jgi:hypothetical protein